jgi:hypothetical protein
MRERGDLENPGVNGRIILNGCKKKMSENVWPGFLWIRAWTSDRLLWKCW